MSNTRYQVSNIRLGQSSESIDDWLLQNVGIGNWVEWIGLTDLPYRSFTFAEQKYESLFILRWM